VFDRTGLANAALCGVSYGGFIALRYAALRPDRVSSLILSSSPAPGWTPTEQQRRHIAHPWRSAPAFILGAPMRLWPEIHAAYETMPQRLLFLARHGVRVLAAPMKPPVMAARVRLQQQLDFSADCANITVPTLVVTGEDALDRIVPAGVTRRYQALIPGAQYARMERSGHIGLITRPAQYAELVGGFVEAHAVSTSNIPASAPEASAADGRVLEVGGTLNRNTDECHTSPT
jgi:pimeloyl-ACP methyl ester carboxylesterase